MAVRKPTVAGYQKLQLANRSDVDSILDDITKTQRFWNQLREGTGHFLFTAEWLQNGFVDRTASTLAWDDSTRTLSVTPSNSEFYYYHKGTKYTVTSAVTKQITDTEGLWIFYFDGDTLTINHTPSDAEYDNLMENHCLVAFVYWDAANNDGRLMEERHSYRMNSSTHRYLHNTVGSAWESGLGLNSVLTDQDASDNEDAQFGVDAGKFHDEDINIDISAVTKTTGLEIWYLDGTSWRWATQAGYSVLEFGVNDRLAFNDSGSQTQVTDGKFVLCHVFATSITDDAGDITGLIAIQGQAEYATKKLAREGAETEIAFLTLGGLPQEELVPLATIIFQTKDTYSNAVEARIVSTDSGDDYVDWRTSEILAAGGVNDHGVLAGLGDDDHAQYLLLAAPLGLGADWDAGANQIRAKQFYADGATTDGGILFGTVGLYEGAANRLDLATGDSLYVVDGAVGIGVVPAANAPFNIRNDTLNTAADFFGANYDFTKTAGATDANDDFRAARYLMTIDDVGSTVGRVMGVQTLAELINGTAENLMGGRFNASVADGTVIFPLFGSHSIADINAGIVDEIVGARSTVLVDAAVTSITGDIKGHEIYVDVNKAPDAHSVSMLYLAEINGVDWGIYQDGTAPHYLQGQVQLPTTGSGAGIVWGGDFQIYRSAPNVGYTPDSFIIAGSLGLGVSPTDQLHLYKNNAETDAQMKLEQDGEGDTAIEFLLSGLTNFIMGIDNSDGDSFKIGGGGALATATGMILAKTTGAVTFGGTVDSGGGFLDNGTPGIDTTFLDNDGNTITVSGGIITAKTAP